MGEWTGVGVSDTGGGRAGSGTSLGAHRVIPELLTLLLRSRGSTTLAQTEHPTPLGGSTTAHSLRGQSRGSGMRARNELLVVYRIAKQALLARAVQPQVQVQVVVNIAMRFAFGLGTSVGLCA